MDTKTYFCSRCGITKAKSFKEIEDKFGWRTMGKVQRPQSQCRNCRNDKLIVRQFKQRMKKSNKQRGKSK